MKNAVSRSSRVLTGISIYALSFLLPVIVLGYVYKTMGVYPFGPNTLLTGDLDSQYIDFFAALRRIITGSGSPFYTWSKVLGGNMTGLFAYYISGPVSLIAALFPDDTLTEAILCMSLIKAGLSGLSFAIFLCHISEKKNIMIVIFSLSYSLMSFTVVYMFCIMWIDAVYMLPLILLGIEKIIKNKGIIFFTVSLSLMLLSNYYTGYMICIFSALYFLYRYFCENKKTALKNFLLKLGEFIAGGLLAAGCSAFLLLPVYFSLKAGKIAFDINNLVFAPNFRPFDLFSMYFTGAYDTVTYDGLPAIYCSMMTLVLSGLYFLNRTVERREKLLSGLIIFILGASFYINTLNIIWHGFQPPVWFPFRYSFLFSFFLCFLAWKAFTNVNSMGKNSIFIITFSFLFIMVIVQKLNYRYLSDDIAFITIMFLILTCLLLFVYLSFVKFRKYTAVLIAAVVILDVFVNTSGMLMGLKNEFSYNTKSNYSNAYKEISEAVNYVTKLDAGFYRMEKTFNRSLNDSIAFGYKGMTHYSSAFENISLNLFKRLGLAQEFYWAGYEGSTLVTDSIFGVKYLLSKSSGNSFLKYYTPKGTVGDIAVYQNPYALPVAFMASDDVLNFKFHDYDCIESQNNLLFLLSGNDKEKTGISYFEKINIGLPFLNSNTKREYSNGEYIFSKFDKTKLSYMEFNLTMPYDSPLYLYAPSGLDSVVAIYINGSPVGEHRLNGNIMCQGAFKAGEKVNIRLTLVSDRLYYRELLVYTLNMENFTRSVSRLKANEMKITEHRDTLLKGSINAGEKQILFTSIPYAKGWRVRLNGKKAEVVAVADSLLAVKVPEGEHEVELRYVPKGLTSGMFISIISLLVLIMIKYSGAIARLKVKGRI